MFTLRTYQKGIHSSANGTLILVMSFDAVNVLISALLRMIWIRRF